MRRPLEAAAQRLELERQVRALNPWPRAYTFANGKRLLVLLARAVDEATPGIPGTVVAGVGKAPLVATGSGVLRLDLVQPEGGREVSGQQYLGNNPGLVWARLG